MLAIDSHTRRARRHHFVLQRDSHENTPVLRARETTFGPVHGAVVGAFVDVSKSVTTDSPNVIVPCGGSENKREEAISQSVDFS
jgi:hypothetical protein